MAEETAPSPQVDRHVVMFSTGMGSWAAAQRVIAAHGPENVTVLFADVKGSDKDNPHAGEDEDNYRFFRECAATWPAEVQIVVVEDGRDIWQVFRDDRFIGNSRLANCSKYLKQIPCREWLEANCDPERTVVHIGIGWHESHRIAANTKGYLPWRTAYPMCEPPFVDNDDIEQELSALGIKPPNLYERGYAHANCGGFCVRMGLGQAAHLLQENPERFAYHERKEQETRVFLGTPSTILRDRTRAGRMKYLGLTEADMATITTPGYWDADGEWRDAQTVEVVRATGKPLPPVAPLTLADFRLRHQAEPEQTDLFDIGGCGCFVEQEVVPEHNTDTEAGAA